VLNKVFKDKNHRYLIKRLFLRVKSDLIDKKSTITYVLNDRLKHPFMEDICTSSQECQDNRNKILDVAESLFAQNGFEATSLREITSTAGINLAAVNYYFRSKDNLIVETLSRAIRPINKQRLDALEQAIAESSPHTVPLEKIIESFIRPCLEISFDPKREQCFRLLGRSMSERGNFIQEIVTKDWVPIVQRYMEEFLKVLPHFSKEDVLWKMTFMVGSVVHTSCFRKDMNYFYQEAPPQDFESTLKRLVQFSVAGFSMKESSL
jgi:AcrR family transcriptional regulator